VILGVFSKLNVEEVLHRLDQAQIANARMNDMEGLWHHPQLAARKRWRSVATPVGSIPALLPPGRVNAWEARMEPIPAVGQHTDKILREIGWTEEAISLLHASGAK
jgi:crotonobetainyl-CoA:carnitine CoA-transferase CaiB-like acyl-CoA transferase